MQDIEFKLKNTGGHVVERRDTILQNIKARRALVSGLVAGIAALVLTIGACAGEVAPATTPGSEAATALPTRSQAQYFDLSLFGAAKSLVPQVLPLTGAEEEQLRRIAPPIMNIFGHYIFSGCQNRAHATFLMLPETLQAKAMKIWVLSPGVIAPAFYGLIGVNTAVTNAQDVSWGFHVALAFHTNHGDIVLDAGLSPNSVILADEWFRMMKIPPLSLWTLSKGDVYEFNAIDVDPGHKLKNDDGVVNENVWSGHYFEDYGGSSLNRDMFVDELARDTVGGDILAGRVCAALTALSSRPSDLLSSLTGSVIAGCEPAFAKFRAETQRLMSAIYGGHASPSSATGDATGQCGSVCPPNPCPDGNKGHQCQACQACQQRALGIESAKPLPGPIPEQ
jgi:hypothetical protein